MKKLFSGFLASLLFLSAFLNFTNISVKAAESSQTLAINEHLNGWLLDEERNKIYAITTEGNLLVIARDTFQVTDSIPIGNGLSDLELDENLLWVSVLDTKEIAKINLNELKVETKFSLSRSPYSIEVIEDKLYYAYDQHSEILVVDITNGVETSLDMDTYYNPALVSDEAGILYVAESGSSGSNVYKISLSTNWVVSESTYRSGYGFEGPERKALIDDDEMFFAGRSLEKEDLAQINGTYNDDESVLEITEDFVLTQKSIYDRDEYRKVMELPFETDYILAPSISEVYLFNDENMTIFKQSYELPNTVVEQVYEDKNQKLPLNQDIEDWVLDEEYGIIYAISRKNNTLLTIDSSTLEVVDELPVGSNPSDIALVDGKLYIANSGSTSILVLDSDGSQTRIITSQNPYRIATDGQYLYFVLEDQWTDIYGVDLMKLSEGVITEELLTAANSFYEPDIEYDPSESILYIGESGSSGSDLYAMNVGDLSLKKTDFNDNYGFYFPSRKLILDGELLYYAKHAILASDLTDEIQSYNEEIVSTSKDYVAATNAIYMKSSGAVKKATLPYDKSNTLISSNGAVYSYVPVSQSIYKFDNVEEIGHVAPSNFTVVEGQEKNLQFSWDGTTADHYKISYKTKNMSSFQPIQDRVIDNQLSFLEKDYKQWAGQTVTFAVQTIIGSYSSDAVTLENTFKPEVPSNFKVKKDTNHNLVFSWDTAVADYYQLSYKTSEMDDFLAIDDEQIVTSEKVLSVEDYQQWIGQQVTFMVRAFAGDKMSDMATFEFLVEDLPTNPPEEENPPKDDETRPVDLKELDESKITKRFKTYEYKDNKKNLVLNLHEPILNEMNQEGDEDFYVETPIGSFRLPIKTLDKLSNDENFYVQVTIRNLPDEILPNINQIAKENFFELLTQPVDFSVKIVEKGISTTITSYGNQFVERRIPLNNLSDLNNLTVVVLDPVKKTYQPVPTTIEKDENGQYWAVFHRNGNSIYAVVQTPKKNFADTTNHWAKKSIDSLTSKMVLNGVSANKFEPNRSVTRAEFAAMLTRALGLLPNEASKEAVFKDIKSSDWFYEDVYAAYASGLINGYPDNTFHPDDSISREEMMVMAIRGFELVNGSQAAKLSLLSSYSDAGKVGEFAKKSIAIAIEHNLVNGRTATTLAPKAKLTRGEAATIIYRLIGKLEF